MRGLFFPWEREKAELFIVFLLVPAVFFCSALRTTDVGPDLFEYYHDYYYQPGTFIASLLQSVGMGSLVVFLVGSFSPGLARSWEKGLSTEPYRQLACAGLLLVIFTFGQFAVGGAAELLLGKPLPDLDWMSPVDLKERLQSLLIALVNGPAEEFLRCYLIARIGSLTRSGSFAVFCSALVFALYHLAYGWITVSYFFILGLFLGWLYLRKNYLLALALWHVLADMTGVFYASEWRSFMALLGIPSSGH